MELSELTVSHAMCCEYHEGIAVMLNTCKNDIERILLLNTEPETVHFQFHNKND